MIKTAAKTLASLAPTRGGHPGPLLPPLAGIRTVSQAIATTVGRQAIQEGLSSMTPEDFEKALGAGIWEPVYQPYELIAE